MSLTKDKWQRSAFIFDPFIEELTYCAAINIIFEYSFPKTAQEQLWRFLGVWDEFLLKKDDPSIG